MSLLEQYSGLDPSLDPFVNVQNECSLPPPPDCHRLSDVMGLVEPRLGASLLGASSRVALRSVAKRIPAALSTFWGLETRLGDPAPRADLLWEIRPGNGGAATLADRSPADPVPGISGALRERSRFWRELGRFAKEWLDSPDWLGMLGNIWLEADIASAADARLDKCLDRPSLFVGANARTAGSDRDLLGRLGTLARRFYGLELDQARIDMIGGTVPAGALVFQMGVMGAREMPIMRLCVKHPDPGVLERWLAGIGWPGDGAGLREILARVAPLCGEIALNVDVLPDRVGEKLGLEVYSAERTLSMDTWQPLFDELLAKGLARAEKLAALGEFPGFQRYRQLLVWRRTPPIGFPLLVTNLHHLKLVVAGDALIEAKAYLAVFRPRVDYGRTRESEFGSAFKGGWL